MKGQGESDAELSSKLAQELEYEELNSDLFVDGSLANDPEFVTLFKKDSAWKINDKSGSDEVVIEREFGNEHVRVYFSVGDVDTSSGEFPTEEDEDGKEATPAEEQGDESFPVNVCITITKPTGGALSILATAADGEFEIDQVSWYADAKLANTMTADADFERRSLYLGPPFETLDEAVQTQFEEYLAERGIDSQLALFIPEYAEYKEDKEYCGWLENVRKFVDV